VSLNDVPGMASSIWRTIPRPASFSTTNVGATPYSAAVSTAVDDMANPPSPVTATTSLSVASDALTAAGAAHPMPPTPPLPMYPWVPGTWR